MFPSLGGEGLGVGVKGFPLWTGRGLRGGVICSPPWMRRGRGGVIRLICYSIYNFEETIQIILLKECTKK